MSDEPVWALDDTPENADWIKNGTWDLPPYCSAEFFQVIPLDQLDWFRTTVVYKAAVAKGLIHDDEWVADYVVDPRDEFIDELMALIKD